MNAQPTPDTVTALRVPPHSIDAEQAVIGAVFANPSCLHDLNLSPEMFYRREHRVVWSAIQALPGGAVDALAVVDQLKSAGSVADAGGPEYLLELASATSSANVRHYAEIVRDRATERRLIAAGHAIADMGFNADGRSVTERLAEAQNLLGDLDTPEGSEPVNLDTCLREAVAEIDRRYQSRGQLLGLSTGYEALDKRTQGLMPGNLVILAGRPGSGKSTLGMNIAEHVALQGQLVIVFSLEMARMELTMRILASQTRVPFEHVKAADMSQDELDKLLTTSSKLRGRDLWIDESSMLTSMQVLSRAKQIARKQKRKPALIVVDYLQLLTDKGDELERITRISRQLKLAAKELNCPVIALSQLNRKVEERNDKRPGLADLRSSGSIEQDADLVWMIYREEVYNAETMRKGIAEVLTRKFRHGQTGEDLLASNLHISRFDNLQPGFLPPKDPPKKRGGGFEYGD